MHIEKGFKNLLQIESKNLRYPENKEFYYLYNPMTIRIKIELEQYSSSPSFLNLSEPNRLQNLTEINFYII